MFILRNASRHYFLTPASYNSAVETAQHVISLFAVEARAGKFNRKNRLQKKKAHAVAEK